MDDTGTGQKNVSFAVYLYRLESKMWRWEEVVQHPSLFIF